MYLSEPGLVFGFVEVKVKLDDKLNTIRLNHACEISVIACHNGEIEEIDASDIQFNNDNEIVFQYGKFSQFAILLKTIKDEPQIYVESNDIDISSIYDSLEIPTLSTNDVKDEHMDLESKEDDQKSEVVVTTKILNTKDRILNYLIMFIGSLLIVIGTISKLHHKH